ncbi:Methyltransferase type 11 [Candidatus Sulfopaludibacter sp. SbA3]|nr:Methyltransferase type 11 [Candidatus Sulfopaludibacter sp. SbA3]
MVNLWLSLPLADYEGHMASPAVQQLGALSDLFAEALEHSRPESVAILGIAGGNGLDRMDGAVTRRIVALDINPSYLDAVRQRYGGIPGLELHCVDLSAQLVDISPVQLVHAALVFEHAGTLRCLENALSLVAAGGALSVVLQLPGESAVGPSEFSSVQNLKSLFSLLDPAWLQNTLARRGFQLERESRRALPGGKAFWMGIFRPARA